MICYILVVALATTCHAHANGDSCQECVEDDYTSLVQTSLLQTSKLLVFEQPSKAANTSQAAIALTTKEYSSLKGTEARQLSAASRVRRIYKELQGYLVPVNPLSDMVQVEALPAGFWAGFAVLLVSIIVHEICTVRCTGPILSLSLPEHTTKIQVLFLMCEVLLAAEIRVAIPNSYIFAEYVGLGITASAVMLTAPFLGAIVGVIVSKPLLSPYDQVFARRMSIVVCIVTAAVHAASAVLVTLPSKSSLAWKFWSFCLLRVICGMALAQVKTAADIAIGRITNSSSQVLISILMQACVQAGAMLGPSISSAAQLMAPGRPSNLSPLDQVKWPEMACAMLLLVFCLFYALVVPEDLPIAAEGNEAVETQNLKRVDTGVEQLSDSMHELLIKSVLYSTWCRSMLVSGLAVSTVLILEIQYSWSSIDSGFAMTCIACAALGASLLQAAVTKFNTLSDLWLLAICGVSCVTGCLFFFDFQVLSERSLLVADALVLATVVVAQGISLGIGRRSSKAHTNLTLEDFTVRYSLFTAVAHLLGPSINRATFDIASRNGYAVLQVLISFCNLLAIIIAWAILNGNLKTNA